MAIFFWVEKLLPSKRDLRRFIFVVGLIAIIWFVLFFSRDDDPISLIGVLVYAGSALLLGASYAGFFWGALAILEICLGPLLKRPSSFGSRPQLYRLALFSWLCHFGVLAVLWGVGLWHPSVRWFKTYIFL